MKLASRTHGPRTGRRHAVVALATVLSLAVSVVAQRDVHPDEIKLKPRIDEAIAGGVESLLREQMRDGSWGLHGNYVGGRTGLCTYALLKSGVQPDHPALRRAFAYLDSIEPTQTYAIACVMLAYSALNDESCKPRIAKLLDRLIESAKPQGDWGYPGGSADLSNTQYAALGLWTAQKIGARVPPEVWLELIDGVMDYREKPHLVEITGDAEGGTRSGQRRVDAELAVARWIERRLVCRSWGGGGEEFLRGIVERDAPMT